MWLVKFFYQAAQLLYDQYLNKSNLIDLQNIGIEFNQLPTDNEINLSYINKYLGYKNSK